MNTVTPHPRVDDRGRAFAGSQLQLQLYSARRLPDLQRAITSAIGGSDAELDWRAPLESNNFDEPLDSAFLGALGLEALAPELKAFWPDGGPRWDGVALLRPSGSVLLVEGKSYPAEMRGSGCQATAERSLTMIKRALDDTKSWLGVYPGTNWFGPLYQYANRLAHVRFLRERGVDAWLVNLCFVNDVTTTPTTEEAWKSGLARAKRELGLTTTSHVAVDVLLPALGRDAWTVAEAG